MIEEGDRIAVGVSGGKDSLTTLNALVRIQKIANIDFEIIPIHIHPNIDRASFNSIEEYCEKLGLKPVSYTHLPVIPPIFLVISLANRYPKIITTGITIKISYGIANR